MSDIRASAYYRYDCTALEIVFTENYDDIPPDLMEKIDEQGCLPCEGGGIPGPWCLRCLWGKEEDEGNDFWNDGP